MSKPLQVPPKKRVAADIERYRKYHRQLGEVIDKLDAEEEAKAMKKIEAPYDDEPLMFTINRSHDPDQWDEISVHDVYEDHRRCYDDDCWYRGNMDRLGELGLYRLRGYDEMILCDVCFENGRYAWLGDRDWDFGKVPNSLKNTDKAEEVEVHPLLTKKEDIKCVRGPRCQYQRPYAKPEWLTCYYKLPDGKGLVCNACAAYWPHCPKLPKV